MSERFSSAETKQSPEVASEHSLELLDMAHETERIIAILIETGPELDPMYRVALEDYLASLAHGLHVSRDDGTRFFEDLKNRLGVTPESVSEILEKHALPDALREAVEKIIAARHEGLPDKAIYRRLARIYHPDQTILEPAEAEEIFKLIGQQLYDDELGFSHLLEE